MVALLLAIHSTPQQMLMHQLSMIKICHSRRILKLKSKQVDELERKVRRQLNIIYKKHEKMDEQYRSESDAYRNILGNTDISYMYLEDIVMEANYKGRGFTLRGGNEFSSIILNVNRYGEVEYIDFEMPNEFYQIAENLVKTFDGIDDEPEDEQIIANASEPNRI